MHVEIGYRKICHLVNRIQLVTMRLSSNLRTGLICHRFNRNGEEYPKDSASPPNDPQYTA